MKLGPLHSHDTPSSPSSKNCTLSPAHKLLLDTEATAEGAATTSISISPVDIHPVISVAVTSYNPASEKSIPMISYVEEEPLPAGPLQEKFDTPSGADNCKSSPSQIVAEGSASIVNPVGSKP